MRKFISLMAVMLLTALCMNAQNFNGDYKYKNILSNGSIGGSVSYNRAVFSDNSQNVGFDLRFTKRIHDNFRIRAIADVNGLGANGFDRYGKAMLGASLDFMPFYVFFDYGANYNPSYTQSKFGAAADAGIGLGWNYFHFEAGADMANNGTLWQSNAFAKVGFDIPLGAVGKDPVNMSIDKHIHETYGEMREENKTLRENVNELQKQKDEFTHTIEHYQAFLTEMEKKLNKCTEENTKLVTNCSNSQMEVYFDYASSFLNDIEENKVARFAQQISVDDHNYIIEGYCSKNGDPYKNEILSSERAEYVYNTLRYYGVPQNKLTWVGHGMSDKDDYLEQKVVIRVTE